MLRAFSVFDDFPQELISVLEANSISIQCTPKGQERPKGAELQAILEENEIVFVSTGQKMSEDMFSDVKSFRIIATASRGIDHIHVPAAKRNLIRIVNATSNSVSVAEHVFSFVFAFSKLLLNGRSIAAKGMVKKEMGSQPQDILGKTIGVIGAGETAREVFRIAQGLQMSRICWTRHPENHLDLKELGVCFTSFESLLSEADIISLHIPLVDETKRFIDARRIGMMRNDSIFINTSRPEIVDNYALFNKAIENPSFSVGIDCDSESVYGLWDEQMTNVIVTPHIAGGTVQSRMRLFKDCVDGVLRNLLP